MVEMNENIVESRFLPEKETLLKKFDIPIDHLDFKYLETCNNVKEIEQILQILKSGQEGIFPDLLNYTEERLAQVNPRSKYLRKMVRVLTKSDIPKNEWQELTADIQNWIEDVSKYDKELTKFQDVKTPTNVPIRESQAQKNKAKRNPERIKSMDYEAWDKLDVDTEIFKMDLNEEKIKQEALEKAKEKEKLNTVVLDPELMPNAELKHSALQAKNAGNECFRSGDYEDALQYYTNSLTFLPTIDVYNNRAITNIKLKNYDAALRDCDEVLKLEVKNEKAYLRKSLAYKYLKQYDNALETLEKLLQVNPNNVDGQNMIQDIKKKFGKNENLRIVRMKIEEECSKTDNCEKNENNVKNNEIKNTATKILHENQDKIEIQEIKKENGSGDNASIKNQETNNEDLKRNNKIENNNKNIEIKSESNIKKQMKETESAQKQNDPKVKNESNTLRLSVNVNKENIIKLENNKKNHGIKNKIGTKKKMSVKARIEEMKNNNVLIPIPSTSKFPGPFYKVVNIPNEIATKIMNTKKTYSKSDEKVIDLNQPASIKHSCKTAQNKPPQSSEANFCNNNKKNVINSNKTDKKNVTFKLNENITELSQSANEIPNKNDDKTSYNTVSQVLKENIDDIEKEKDDKFNNITNDNSCERDKKLNHLSGNTDKNLKNLIPQSKNQNVDTDNKEHVNNLYMEGINNTEENIFTPFEFLKYWQAIKNDPTLEEHEKLLRLLNPMDLVNVIGNKLDGEMCSVLLKCLESRFTEEKDSVFVANVLIQLQKLPRIDIIMLFMNDSDKKIIQNLIGRIKTDFASVKEICAKYCRLINI